MENYKTYKIKKSARVKPLFSIFTKIFSLLLFSFFLKADLVIAENPMGPIEETVEEILVILKTDNKIKWAEKRRGISEIIEKRFDFQEQSRLVLASHWQKINEEEKRQFISLFSKLQEYVFLNRLKDYSDEEVLFTNQKIKGNKAVVLSTVVKETEKIPIVYRMKKNQDNWYVYDVIIDGVSLVKNYRQQFSAIIEKEKFAGLIVKMEEQIERIVSAEES